LFRGILRNRINHTDSIKRDIQEFQMRNMSSIFLLAT